MTLTAEKQTEGFLLRLRKQDTPTGVSNSTIEKLMETTGLSKTELAHLALRQMADRYLPRYELDDGPLTTAQSKAIRRASKATDIPEERFNERLL
ncbi:hypothetical protein [Pseudomonas schmalbachii]|uniref:Uncharacterized protein n=1 Tax=Pseudomonas schmalbachii TaxID=2816993 RepID=A0ABS3TM05_9PSED|nr:hypothetical protein [Pseudomonas schmalbachii]MBO3274153.1 hypothetical protein [Pseudomonas schmalbachii]